ncbi:ParB N-terminal domain-containing protein [Albidovulum sediminicola]|uniref:ParB N-terminal domain-containing protein n=1 Tax=Albidovulum sediminicola TaxID=2984331 RepID=A0ABT2YZU8_9RHOB|nr:ParB N-terminal domain-containing protein [Defluviimonas sp. WL0075]MCV2864414.1 ParB N-terminal domain-containing protein [Defluviimonas sp. WL0075]
MAKEKLDLETYMVDPVLRDRLYRVNPEALTRDYQPMGELDAEDISEIVEAICTMGFLNPVLVDEVNVIVAGQGLVEAAARIGLEDIPALRLEDLDEFERRVYFHMTHHFYKIAGLDPEVFRVEAQHILSFTASGRLALELFAAKSAVAA